MVDLGFAARVLPVRGTGTSFGNGCEESSCAALDNAATRLAETNSDAAGEHPAAVLSPDQSKTYEVMRRIAQGTDDAQDACSPLRNAILAPIVVGVDVFVARLFHQTLACYGVAAPNRTVNFSRLE